jgi:deoxyribose-phosphate aldolase
VIGFPNGYSVPEIKAQEAAQAVVDGADEIDMVINLGFVKEANFDAVLREIELVRRATEGKILKVIIETCLLTDEEKIRLCEIVGASGADYIKTSTGFSTGGATEEDIRLFAKYVKKPLLIKAAGGIKTIEDAELFLSLGADRLGTSRIVKIVKESK